MRREWTRDELIRAAEGHRVGARDAIGDYVPLPPWLADATDDEITYDLVDFVELVHPDDRSAVVDLYTRTQTSPGEQVSASIGFGPAGNQRVVKLSLINLVDVADIGVILAILEETDVIVAGGFDGDTLSDQQPTDWMIIELASSAVILKVEGSSKRLLGYEPSEMIGRVPAEFLSPDDLLASIQMLRHLRLEPEVTRTSRRRWIRSDGSTIWMESSYANRRDPLPGQGEVLMVMWDITAKMAAEQALRDSEANLRRLAEDLRALADEVPAAVFKCSLDGSVTFHNARWSRLIEQADGIDRIHDLFSEEDRADLERLFAELSRGRDHEARSVELTGRDRTTIWELTVRLLREADGQAAFMGSLEDITSTARLRDQATQDPLTGLLNRSAIEAAVQDALSVHAESVTVVFIDLDRFKTVNDTWGHDAGDAVLVGVADRLRQNIRPTDAAGRWGGDEFILLLSHHGAGGDASDDRSCPRAVVDRLRTAFDTPVEFDGGSWIPRASMGMATARPGDDLEMIVRAADRAMFDDKPALKTSSKLNT